MGEAGMRAMQSVAIASVWVCVAWAAPAVAADLGTMSEKAAASLEKVPLVLRIVIYIVGLGFLLWSGLKAVRASGNPQQQSWGGVIVVAVVGVFLLLGPSTVNWIAGTFGIESQGGKPVWGS